MTSIEHFYRDFIMELAPIFLDMQVTGVKIDNDRRATLSAKYTNDIDESFKRLEAFAGYPLKAQKSFKPKALLQLLYEDMKLPKQYNIDRKTGKRSLTADKKALDKLEAKVEDNIRPYFGDVKEIRELVTLRSTFLEAPLDSDNRLRWSTNVGGTVTGRLTTSASPWWSGANVQNWKEECRETVIADDNEIFINGDGAQADARVVAWLAQDKHLMATFNSEGDIHLNMASMIFDIPRESMSKKTHKYERGLAKATVHAAHYGMGKRKAAMLMKLSEARAEQILNRYHARFPGVKSKFQLDIQQILAATKTLITPFRRQRQFFGRWNDDLFREAYAYIPQSSVADWTDTGILRMVRFSKGLFDVDPGSYMDPFLTIKHPRFVKDLKDLIVPIRPSIQVHDSILCASHYEYAQASINLMLEAMHFNMPFPKGPLEIPCDIQIGRRWGKMLAVKENPGWLEECILMAKEGRHDPLPGSEWDEILNAA